MYRIQASILCRQIAMLGYWVRVTHQRGDYALHIATPAWDETLSSTDPKEIRNWIAAHPPEDKP